MWNQTASALYGAPYLGVMMRKKTRIVWNQTDDDALYDARRLGVMMRKKTWTEWSQTDDAFYDARHQGGTKRVAKHTT